MLGAACKEHHVQGTIEGADVQCGGGWGDLHMHVHMHMHMHIAHVQQSVPACTPTLHSLRLA